MSVLLRYTDSDYLFGIFKLFLAKNCYIGTLFKFSFYRIAVYSGCGLFKVRFRKVDGNEHDILSNIILRHKSKLRNNVFIAVLHFTITIGS